MLRTHLQCCHDGSPPAVTCVECVVDTRRCKVGAASCIEVQPPPPLHRHLGNPSEECGHHHPSWIATSELVRSNTSVPLWFMVGVLSCPAFFSSFDTLAILARNVLQPGYHRIIIHPGLPPQLVRSLIPCVRNLESLTTPLLAQHSHIVPLSERSLSKLPLSLVNGAPKGRF